MKALKQIEKDFEYLRPTTTFKNPKKQWSSTKNIKIKDEFKKKDKKRKNSAAQAHNNILNEFCNERNMIRFKLLDKDSMTSENLDSDRFLKMKRKEYFSAIKKNN